MKKHKGGAPTKVPGGLDRAIYIRADAKTTAKLKAITRALNRSSGRRLSMADAVRWLIETTALAE